MILVFLLFGIIILIILIINILLLSSIKVKFIKLHIFYSKKKLNIVFLSKLGLYLFNKLKLFQITIDDEKIKELYKFGKINVNKLKNNKDLNKLMLKLLRNLNLTLDNMILKGYIGTENAALTAYIVAFINSIIPIILSNKIYNNNIKDYYCKIGTVYTGENIINLEFNCIISIKIVHIINMLYIYLVKRRVKKNERPSNRRTYAYSYE